MFRTQHGFHLFTYLISLSSCQICRLRQRCVRQIRQFCLSAAALRLSASALRLLSTCHSKGSLTLENLTTTLLLCRNINITLLSASLVCLNRSEAIPTVRPQKSTLTTLETSEIGSGDPRDFENRVQRAQRPWKSFLAPPETSNIGSGDLEGFKMII